MKQNNVFFSGLVFLIVIILVPIGFKIQLISLNQMIYSILCFVLVLASILLTIQVNNLLQNADISKMLHITYRIVFIIVLYLIMYLLHSVIKLVFNENVLFMSNLLIIIPVLFFIIILFRRVKYDSLRKS